jgi:uncharacterized protein (TIGR02147 family)
MEYREYLLDYYNEQKKDKPFFSYRFIGHHVGMDSSYVIKVLQSALHISSKKVESFITLLNLNESEADYFETLVHFNKAKTERQRKLYFEKLFTISTVKAQKLDVHQYEFFQKWYYSAIWSIINCVPFNGNFHVLAEQCQPAITVWDAKRAVKLLSRLELIKQDADGLYRTTNTNLSTGPNWQSHAIEGYQREMSRLASESLDKADKKGRDISTVTLCADEKSMPEIQEYIRQFRSSLIKMVNSYGGTGRVYQLNVQLFPLSKNLEEKP